MLLEGTCEIVSIKRNDRREARCGRGGRFGAARYDPMMENRPDLAGLKGYGFAFPGSLRDELTALALAGVKTATAALLVEYDLEDSKPPEPGARDLLLDSDERPVAVVETVECRVVRLADVDDQYAIDEGEGYANAAEFRVAHERFWNGYLDELREQLGDPGFEIDDDTLVVCERFRVIERLDGG